MVVALALEVSVVPAVDPDRPLDHVQTAVVGVVFANVQLARLHRLPVRGALLAAVVALLHAVRLEWLHTLLDQLRIAWYQACNSRLAGDRNLSGGYMAGRDQRTYW
jgi:hypothetical protein